jgi:hypothetical protein
MMLPEPFSQNVSGFTERTHAVEQSKVFESHISNLERTVKTQL